MKATTFFFVITTIIATTTFLQSMDLIHQNKKTRATQRCYRAIQNNNPKKVKKAIAQGADVNHIPESHPHFRENLLQLALHKEYIPVIETLLTAKDIEVNKYPENTLPPLHLAVFTGKLNIVKLLLDYPKTNVNMCDSRGCTCLFIGLDSVFSNQRIVRELLEKKIDTTIVNLKGDTILHYACEKGALDWVNLILTTNNIPINAQNNRGDTPLHIACRMNAYLIVQALLSSPHPIDLQLYNNNRKSVCDIALESEYYVIVSLFFDCFKELINIYRDNIRLFNYTIRADKPHILRKILPSAYVAGEKNYIPLIEASSQGYINIVNLLFKQKNCNPLQINNHHQIALHYAAENGHLECVQRLCEYGGIDHQDKSKNTPLHLASKNQHIPVINYLIRKKANTLISNRRGFVPFLIIYKNNIQNAIEKKALNHMIHAKDINNNSLFHILTEIDSMLQDTYDYDNCLQFLLNHGLDIYAQNDNKRTALDIINHKNKSLLLMHDKRKLWYIPSTIIQSFLRVASDNISYVFFREILQNLPQDLRIFILILYYKLNTEIIFAKICKKVPIPPLLDHHLYQQLHDLKKELPDNVNYFPLLYQPAILSFE